MVTNNRFSFLLLLLVLNAVEGFAQPSSCESPTMDGYTYDVVQIGDQCWFAENLRTSIYRNGDSIPEALNNMEWSSTMDGASAVYGMMGGNCAYAADACDPDWSLQEYGRLYNAIAVAEDRGLCPTGWHVPTDNEWKQMELAIGLPEDEIDSTGNRGQAELVGTSLKLSTGWWTGTGTDIYDFGGKPSGYRYWSNGALDNAGLASPWWTATADGEEYWWRSLYHSSAGIQRGTSEPNTGHAVRCILGDSAAVILGCTDPNFLEYNPLATVDDGSCATPVIQDCASPTMDGYTYDVVQIGDQCWFAENLRTTVYRNGDSIPNVTVGEEWGALNSGEVGALCAYDNETSNAEDFGLLYNGYAVSDDRALCPIGWHLPSDQEWMIMELELGLASSELGQNGWRGSEANVGHSLKATEMDSPAWNGENSFGFNAEPGGFRFGFSPGEFSDLSALGNWWTASLRSDGNGIIRRLSGAEDGIRRDGYGRLSGLSVRCILGDSSAVILGCTDSNFLEYDPLATVDDGSCATPVIEDCASPTMDGYTYDVVQIGDQCWFAENLRTSIYCNGNPIPAGLNAQEWSALTGPASAVYGEGDAGCTEDAPGFDACMDSLALAEYGRLYNGYAVFGDEELCPVGWHVPNDLEWKILEMHVGMAPTELNALNVYRGGDQNVGSALKATQGWLNDGNGTDDFGFGGLPAGSRGNEGTYYNAGKFAPYWTSTPNLTRDLSWNQSGIYRDPNGLNNGYAVRCILGDCPAMSLGCTDPDACNYDALASDDDGSCSQLQVTEVVGLTEVAAGTVTTYAAEEATIGNSYTWTVTGGEITAGQGTPYIVVAWNQAGDHSISVVESNADCGEVTITVAVSVTEVMGVGETMVSAGLAVTVAPNPFRSDFTLLMTLPRHARVAASLWDMNGKRIQNSMMEPLPVGEHALHISTANLPAGIYAVRVRFEGEGWTESKVLRIVKE